MKNLGFIILITTLLLGQGSNAFEIVYPKNNEVTVNSPTTFFIGNEIPDKELTINNDNVKIHKSGGFFHPVDLEHGENNFTITNRTKTSIYKITRNKEKPTPKSPSYIQYDSPKILKTKENNTVLRSTPIDKGVNRLQHYDDELYFKAIGEINDFYKIQLADDDFAYIKKSQLIECEYTDLPLAQIINQEYFENQNKIILSIKLDKKIPYTVNELNSFALTQDGYDPVPNKIDIMLYNINNTNENKFEYQLNLKNVFGYKSYYKPDNTLIVEAKKIPHLNKSKPLNNITITIDAGHGGSEYGAIGCLGDKEKDINLDIAQKLKPLLESAGAKVVMTRNGDNDLSLSERVDISKKNNTDVFISIHNNALPDSAAKSNRSGTSVYFFYPQSCLLARTILNTLIEDLKTNNDKVRDESFAVIRNTESLSILVEVGYMINPEDNANLVNEEYRKKVAEALKHGLENYFNYVSE